MKKLLIISLISIVSLFFGGNVFATDLDWREMNGDYLVHNGTLVEWSANMLTIEILFNDELTEKTIVIKKDMNSNIEIGEKCTVYVRYDENRNHELLWLQQEEGKTIIGTEQRAEFLQEIGILKGYEDGSLHLDNELTRAEFATMLYRVIGKRATVYKSYERQFADIVGHWAEEAIINMFRQEIAKGISATEFAPDDALRYEQMVTFAIRVTYLENDALRYGGYPDGYLKVAEEYGLISGREYIRKATRADAVNILYESINHSRITGGGVGA